MPAWSGLYDHVHGQSHSLTGSRDRTSRDIGRDLKTRAGRKLGKLIQALTGAAVGATATATHKQVQGPSNPTSSLTAHGGARVIETVTDVNRATVAADETLIDTMADDKFAPASYPSSGDGRLSGGMVGKL